MAEKKRVYEGPQCQAMVHPEDGSESYQCRLGVWKKHPDDGFCYMHHPKVDLRGGAARVAIDKGEMQPKTSKARKRLSLNKKVKLKRRKKKIKEDTTKEPKEGPTLEAEYQDSTLDKSEPYQVTFTEHMVVDEDGDIRAEGKVSFVNQTLAKGFYKVLSDTSLRSPMINGEALYFYSNVQLTSSKA